MDRITRLRRVGILCCHFSRNYSYYRAGWHDNKKTKAPDQFWATVQGNFIDTAVIEWTKLFGNHNDVHHWKKIVTDPDLFKSNMLQHCNLDSNEFDSYHKEIKSYRDQFVAHLDSAMTMYIPDLTNAQNTTEYYYEFIYSELPNASKIGLPPNLNGYINDCFSDSEYYFDRL